MIFAKWCFPYYSHPAKKVEDLDKAVALCRPSTCLDTTIAINDFTVCPNAENRGKLLLGALLRSA